MDVEFVSHATVRDAVGEKRVRMTVADGVTVGQALHQFAEAYDGVGPLVFDGDGDIRPNVTVLVEDENVRFDEGIDEPLADGDTVTLAPGVSGGCGGSEDASTLGGA